MTTFSNSTDSVRGDTNIRARVSVDRNIRLTDTKIGSEYSVVIPDIPRHGIPLSTVSRASGRLPGNVGDNNEGRHLATAAETHPPMPSFINAPSPQQHQQPQQQQHQQQPLHNSYNTPTFSHAIQPAMVSLTAASPLHTLNQHHTVQQYPQTVHIPLQPVVMPPAQGLAPAPIQPVFITQPAQVEQVRYVPVMQSSSAPFAPQPSYRPIPYPAEVPAHMYPSLPSHAPVYADYSMAGGAGPSLEAGPPGYRTLQSPRNSIPEESVLRDNRLRQQGFSTAGGYYDDPKNTGHHSQISYTADNVSSIMIG